MRPRPLVVVALLAAFFFVCLSLMALPVYAAPIEVSGSIAADTTWGAGNLYIVVDDVTVEPNVTLIIEPGTIVKVHPDKAVRVNGVLKVLGTAAAPVTFTSFKDDTVGGDTNGDGAATTPAKGDWGHIVFLEDSTDAENLIEDAVIRYGGDYASPDPFCMPWDCWLGSSVRFVGASPTVRDSTIEESTSFALSATIDSFPVVSGNTLTNNDRNGLEMRIYPGNMTMPAVSRWSNTDVVYVLTSHATVYDGQTLILDPGVKVKLVSKRVLGVHGTLKVLGTPAAPVTCTSLKDDTVGGDTNGDGAASTPAKGDWGHIVFFSSSVDAESLIEHAVIRHGGNVLSSSLYDYYGCKMGCYFHGVILFDNASPTVRYSDISLNKRGLNAKASQPVLTCNNIHANDSGLNNATPDTVVDAANQWWGSASGPQHATNPSGTGNEVSDGVNFTPWRTLACGMAPPAPTDLKARGLSPTQVSLQWVDNTADESEYRIERAAPAADPQWAEIATVSANVVAYEDGPYTCSSSPTIFRVRAYSAADQLYSDYSNTATGASAPCAPANLQAGFSSPITASLVWQDTSSDQTQFDVERSADGGTTWSLVTSAPADQTLYNDPGLACSSKYLYRIRAYRSQDEAYSDYSNVVEVLTHPCAPSGAAAKILPTGAVELVWQDNANDVSEFHIERRGETDATWLPLAVAQAGVVSHVDATVSCGLTYVYRVRSYRALDDQFSAAYSNEAAVQALLCTPTALKAEQLAPTGLC